MLSAARLATPAARALGAAAKRGYTAPLKDMQFCIDEVHGFPAHYAEVFAGRDDVNDETLQMVLQEVGKFCENEIAPLDEVGDSQGCEWVDERTAFCGAGMFIFPGPGEASRASFIGIG